MSVHIENLHPGDWITSCDDLRPKADEGSFSGRSSSMTFDGVPWKVKAVCPPFVIAERQDGVVATMDLRNVGVTKLSKAYVRACRDTQLDRSDPTPVRRAEKKIKTKRDPRDCPRCGQRMVQRIPNGSVTREWHRVCPDCGYDQGPVKKGATQ